MGLCMYVYPLSCYIFTNCTLFRCNLHWLMCTTLFFFVSGSASFALGQGEIDLWVSENGTIAFNLTLSFSSHGYSGYQQEVQRLVLKKGSDIKISCVRDTGCSVDDRNRWWSINGDDTSSYVFILHQAVSDDLGEYTASVDLTIPVSSMIDTRVKMFTVNGKI